MMIKCAACKEITPKSEWKEATNGIVNGTRTLIGGCPVCRGEYYEVEDKDVSINEELKRLGLI